MTCIYIWSFERDIFLPSRCDIFIQIFQVLILKRIKWNLEIKKKTNKRKKILIVYVIQDPLHHLLSKKYK
jgi:hypothetical protein